MTAPKAVLIRAQTIRRPRSPRALRSVLRSWGGRIGLVLLGVVVLMAFLGPLVAPHDPTETLGVPGAPPSPDYALGLDSIGRDVLSRLLNGGRSTLLMAVGATILTYAGGVVVGLVAGISRSFLDAFLMRGMDVLLSMPALLVVLLLRTGLGNNSAVLMSATALVLIPGVARITRSAALGVSTTGYVEAAMARGEPKASLLVREVLPNIRGTLIADVGLRFSWAIIVIASVNFLGIGLEPPSADWGLMVSENRVIIGSNPWSVAGPAAVLGLLVIGLNLIGDSYVRNSDRSEESS
ncbi:peptide/nickel transport system permease protein [Actinomadura madurae]|uniref:Peptide/nickel transport system permease protein n=1 Tax=Actinomadura madurae TaxID=1993 RepID=A0A1I5I4I8_9ACTN|nr:ABC transporter permease [Actinomadura madurae]SFO55558.1 peptide/nickel transport system permease protein [Actinomadura madurae]